MTRLSQPSFFYMGSTLQWDDNNHSGSWPRWRSLTRIDRKPRHSAVFQQCCPLKKPSLKSRCYWFSFIFLWLIRALSCWLVLGLAITVVNPFNCCNAENAHKIFLHNHHPNTNWYKKSLAKVYGSKGLELPSALYSIAIT